MSIINWESVINQTDNLEVVALRESPIGENVSVTFDRVFQTKTGSIGAIVSTTLSGELIWLSSEQYGPQNGLLSLVKANEGNTEFEGKTFNFCRVESEKSQTGYAYRWTV